MESLIFLLFIVVFAVVVILVVKVVVRLLSFGTDTALSKLAFNLPTYASPLCDNEVDWGETIGSTRFY
jgi:hypothetical protein